MILLILSRVLCWLAGFGHLAGVQSVGLSDAAASPTVVRSPRNGDLRASTAGFFVAGEGGRHYSANSIASGDPALRELGRDEFALPPAPVDADGIPVELETDPGTPEVPGRDWSVRLTAVGRALRGQVQVREHEFQGTPLSLSGDLGYGYQLGGRADLTVAGSDLETLFEVEYLDGSASRSAGRDFSYNGAFYTAGEHTRTLTHFLTVRIHLAWKSFSEPSGGWWTGPILGIEYPYYYMNLTTSSIPHNSEDWTHYYPYPVIGWAGRVRLAEGLSGGGRATVGYFPNLPSGFIEGGRLSVSVRPSVWVDLPLTWHVSRSVRLSAGFEYQYWYGGDHSIEDGNKLRFSSAGGTLALEFVW